MPPVPYAQISDPDDPGDEFGRRRCPSIGGVALVGAVKPLIWSTKGGRIRHGRGQPLVEGGAVGYLKIST